MSVPTRSSQTPANGVFETSSIFGKSGSRSAMVLRIAASSADAAVAAKVHARAATMAATVFFMGMLSGAERLAREPALGGGEPVDESQAAVAKFPPRGGFVRKQAQQAVGDLGHGPGRRRALARIAAQQARIAEPPPGLARGQHTHER